jgi:septal ring factor EnvC (AmiA/AmiB activator)
MLKIPIHLRSVQNMNLLRSVSSIVFLFLASTLGLFGQGKEELQKERNELNKKIELTNQLIKETQQKQSSKQQTLVLLNKKVGYRDQLIKNYNKEARELERNIKNNESEIQAQELELQSLKDEYAHLIRQAYKNRDNYDQLMFIFSAESFNQAYKRMKFIQQYTQYRHKQAEAIKSKSKALEELNVSLLSKIEEKKVLADQVNSEKSQLQEDLNKQQLALNSLKQDEKSLKKQLKEQEDQRKRLNKAIDRIIAEEIKKTKKANDGSYTLTPEAKELSDNFSKNKGKLPWPVEKGVITSAFGIQNHAFLPGIKVENNGVDIATEEGAAVRSVFSGTISAVLDFQNMGKAVIINHGAYRTVYSNLNEVFVTQGQVVDVKQTLGTVMTNKQSGKTESHFEILYIDSKGEFVKQNPALWIAR